MRPVIDKLCQIIRDTTDYVSTYPFFCKGLNTFDIVRHNVNTYCIIFECNDSSFYLQELSTEEVRAVHQSLLEYKQRKVKWVEQQLLNYGLD